MMHNNRPLSGLLRRAEAGLLAAGTLWTVTVTAGSSSLPDALCALRNGVALAALRWEMAGAGQEAGLSPAVAMVLRETPLLYSQGDGALWERGETGDRTDGTNGTNGTNGEDGTDGTDGTNGEEIPPDEMPLPGDQDRSAEQNPETGTNQGTNSGAVPVPLQEEQAEPSDNTASENPDGAVSENPDNTGSENTNNAVPEKSDDAAPENPNDTVPENPDNGVRAKTLVVKDPDGYTTVGRVYISSSRRGTLDPEELRETFAACLTGEAPQVLILHSHGSEAYTPVPGTEVVWSGDCRTTDFRYSVVKAGDEMAAVFQEAGISVLHDRTLYDYPNYTGSYQRSLAAIQSYLAQYPSIHFILDVHRDSIADAKGNQYKVISEIEGVGTAAQMTLVVGSDGAGDPHPGWKENLKLAVAVQEQILSKYPTLMRPILLRKSRYNQHATSGSLLVEVGASGNSPEEAFLAARLFAQEMAEVLQARTK